MIEIRFGQAGCRRPSMIFLLNSNIPNQLRQYKNKISPNERDAEKFE